MIASKSWGNHITRICTWARLVDRDGRGFWKFNVHLDHESQPSRERSAQLLRQRIDARAFPNEPVVITGDFNAGEKNAAVTAMTAGGIFVDSFRVAHKDEQTVGTFTGFDVTRRRERRSTTSSHPPAPKCCAPRSCAPRGPAGPRPITFR